MSFDIEAELIAAYDVEQIKQWSNPGNNTNAEEVNSARVLKAFAHAKGRFKARVGAEFDETKIDMIPAIVVLTCYYLSRFASRIGDAKALWEEIESELEQLRDIYHRATIEPTYTNLDASRGEPDEPKFTSKRLRGHGFPGIGSRSSESNNYP